MEKKRAKRSGGFLIWKGRYFNLSTGNNLGFTAIVVTAAVSVLALAVIIGWQAANAIREKENAAHFVAKSGRGTGDATFFSSKQGNSSGMTIDNTLFPQDISDEQAGSAAAAFPQDSGNPVELTTGRSTELTTGPNDVSRIGNRVVSQLADTYSELQQMGAYTPEQGERIASNIASSIRAEISYTPITILDIKTDSDTSYQRMLAYRSDLQGALQPLLLNRESEIEIFGRYIESRDRSHLNKLEEVAGRYKEAAGNLKEVTAPADAAAVHLAIANSLLEFAAILELMAGNADDTMAILALLRSYNSAEQDVLTSFNSLALYQKQKASS